MNSITRLLAVPVLCLLAGCGAPAFSPTPSPNPWADDYSAITGMDHYKEWGTYNVHDPSCRKLGDYYYMYSTDAIFHNRRPTESERAMKTGFVQVRRSKDLVQWEFVGWAFPEIPKEAVEWVRANADGHGAVNIWAPYIIPYGDKYRLYYCVSAFGRKASYLGLAEASSPEGPWTQVGCVARTNDATPMNAIDPSVIDDPETGRWWMHYGSYFGGLYCVELNPETGLTLRPGDLGHLTARRANYRKDNLEAPEIFFLPETRQYYLFTSYDPLMTTYNVRVGRSAMAPDDFTDFTGQALRDTTNNFPILTAPYRFAGHPGWAGTGHCCVFQADGGRYFMAHQARLSPQNQQMVLHVRQLFFLPNGWCAVSPERYAGTPERTFRTRDLVGDWEIIRVREPLHERQTEAGQVLHGEGELQGEECNVSTLLTLVENGSWSFDEKRQALTVSLPGGETVTDLVVFAGHDWEKEQDTVLFTGLDSHGRSVWGKRVK
ncbi:MAG: arabinan endo-1,5-alpha-L-arabinosidase [Mediterranea sp.]|jgi:arabinan endo-1,5-alpha-L-arabinosidase|nr:arabinan endo-1,5-alpha-L-arabinosidase [Mediterranea sp.]